MGGDSLGRRRADQDSSTHHGLAKAALLTAVPFALFHMPLHFIGDYSIGSLTGALVTLLIVCVIDRLMIGVFLRGTGGSILAVAVLHTLFNRSNNDEGMVAALVEGDGRKLAGLISILILTAVAAMVVRRHRSADQAGSPPSTEPRSLSSLPSHPRQGPGMNTNSNTPTTQPVHGSKRRPGPPDHGSRRCRRQDPRDVGRHRQPRPVAVRRRGRLRGPADRRAATVDDQYPWFSMTKIATATAAMRLHAEGVLDIDAPIGTYLPDYRAHPTHGHPTTRELLSHTAGLGNPLPVRWVRPADQPPDPALLAEIITKHGTPKHPVGARASYSNIGYLLAGEVIASATGATIEACVRDRVLVPLGMEKTGYDYHPDDPRAVGYVRTPRVAVPLLRALLPSGIVGPRVQGHTALNPFLVNGAAYGGLVGTRRRRGPTRSCPRRRHDGPPPRAQPHSTSRRCAPSPRREAVRPRHRLVPQADRCRTHAPRSSSTTAPAAATGTRCASTPTSDSPSSR